MRIINERRGWFLCVAYAPDGKLLASGCGYRDEGAVMLADLRTRRETRLGTTGVGMTSAVGFARDGRVLASAGFGGTVRLWDVAGRKEKATLPANSATRNPGEWLYVLSLAFSPGNRALALGVLVEQPQRKRSGKERWVHTGEVRLVNLRSGREGASLRAHGATVFSSVFSPDGKLLASGSADTTIKLWDVETRQELATIRGHEKTIRSLAFTPDGGRLISGSEDGTVRVWDVARTVERGPFDWGVGSIHSVAVAPDGTTAAAAGRGGIVIWDLE
jgi:WD40 repeat protein